MSKFRCGMFYDMNNQCFVLAKSCTMDYNNFVKFRDKYLWTGDIYLDQTEYNKLCYQLLQGRLQHKITDDGK